MPSRLFVFDEAVPARAELCAVLERAGFIVLAGAVQDDVDRILDVYEPHALLARLAADPTPALGICRYGHRAPVVLMAAPDVPADSRVAARRAGADRVLIEPIDPAELLACLETLLAHRSTGKALEAHGPRVIQTVREFGYVLRSQPATLKAVG